MDFLLAMAPKHTNYVRRNLRNILFYDYSSAAEETKGT
ncbi:MAG: hypothetical protein FD188_1271 [Ignavibacteria bacterium]|nr:MAG: hypothetical protein FD188_1271 [Ignavibacteria bacterium]